MIVCLVALFLMVTVAVMAKIAYAAVGFGEYLGGDYEPVGARTVKIYSTKNKYDFRSITLNDVGAQIETCGWVDDKFVIRYHSGQRCVVITYDSPTNILTQRIV